MLKLDGAFAGPLLAPFRSGNGACIELPVACAPGLESEFLVKLADDVPARDRPYPADEIAPAVDYVAPSFEIVGCRLPGGLANGGLVLIADGGGNVAFVEGARGEDWRSIDLAACALTVTVNGEEKARGTGSMLTWGEPLAAVGWLAAHPLVAERGLRAGDVVMTGTCGGILPIAPVTRRGRTSGRWGPWKRRSPDERLPARYSPKGAGRSREARKRTWNRCNEISAPKEPLRDRAVALRLESGPRRSNLMLGVDGKVRRKGNERKRKGGDDHRGGHRGRPGLRAGDAGGGILGGAGRPSPRAAGEDEGRRGGRRGAGAGGAGRRRRSGVGGGALREDEGGLRAARLPVQQRRRQRPRGPARRSHRRAMAQRRRRQPDRGVPLHPGGVQADEEPEADGRTHREQRIDLRPCAAPALGALHLDQARDHRADPIHVARRAEVRHRLRPESTSATRPPR